MVPTKIINIQREIDKVIFHHTGTDVDHSIEELKRMHVEERGWLDVGYHFLIRRHGIQFGRPLEMVGAHCKGHNKTSIGIALTGRFEFDESQFKMAARLIDSLFPGLPLFRHKDFAPTECPNFCISEITRLLAKFVPG